MREAQRSGPTCGVPGWQAPIVLAAALLIVGLVSGPATAGEGIPDTCDESLGFGRVARDGDACVILGRIIVAVASGYSVDQAAAALEQLEGWTVTAKLSGFGLVTAKYAPDTLTLTELDAQRDAIEALPWAERVDRDAVAAADTLATGSPTIRGTAQVGQTLTADTAGIADADGLSNVRYRYQWLVSDGSVDSAIEGATDSTYTVRAAEVGKTIKVRVTFTDDTGNDEALTSAGRGPVTLSPGSGAGGGETGRGSGAGGGSPATTEEEPELIGYLENPGLGSYQSGIGVISGWVCEAETVKIELNGQAQPAAYGTERADTEAVCGDTDNGFGLLVNWNVLGDGEHEVVALVDGVELGRATVTVTTLGEEFVRGVAGEVTGADFPSPGESVQLAWQQSLQNFVLIPETREPVASPAGPGGGPTGVLENPGPGSYQSGIGVISGWVCEAEMVEIELSGAVQPAAYGTERTDTEAVCGDTYNGFGLLINWNVLGEGEQTVRVVADGAEVGRATFTVTTLGEEFVRGATGEVTVGDFSRADASVRLAWQESLQNFGIVAYTAGAGADAGAVDAANAPPEERGTTGGRGSSSGGGGRPSAPATSSPRSQSELAGGDLPTDTSTTGRLVVGSPATGRFHAQGENDWFAVDLERGYRYTFAIRGGDTEPTDAPDVSALYNDQGRNIPSTYSTTERSHFFFTPHREGRYYLEAKSRSIDFLYGATGIGTYVLTLTAEAVSPPPLPPPPTDDYGSQMDATTPTLTVGESVTGHLEYVGDLVYGFDQDVFAVELVAGQSYRIEMSGEDDESWYANLEGIHDPAGRLIPGTQFEDYDLATYRQKRQWFTAATTGRHYIVAGVQGGPEFPGVDYLTNVYGDERRYQLSIVAMDPPDDYPEGGQVTVGGTVTGNLDWPGDEDRFAMEMVGGTTYRIDLLHEQGSQGRAYLAGVYATEEGNGNADVHVSSTEVSFGRRGEYYYERRRVHVTPAAAGTYELAVGNEKRKGRGEGAYELTVTTFAGEVEDFPADTSTPKSVTADGSPMAGRIHPLNDVDWWRVEFTAGQTYRFDVAWKSGDLWRPNLQGIYDAQGGLIPGTSRKDYKIASRKNRQWFTATTTGTHYIAVGGIETGAYVGDDYLNSLRGGVYELEVRAMDPPDDYAADTTTTGQVTVDGTVAGRFEQPSDVDWFAADLAADTIYRIDLRRHANWYMRPSLAGVYSATGHRLPNTTDEGSGGEGDSRVYFTPTTAGTYYIAARNDAGEGAYELAVTVTDKADDFAAGTGTQGTVVVGSSVTGEIEAPGDEDWFAVTLTKGVPYRIDLEGANTGQGTLADPKLEGIYTASGALINSSHDNDSGEGRNARKDYRGRPGPITSTSTLTSPP